MQVLIYEPRTMWAKCFIHNLQKVTDTNDSPYHIVRPGTAGVVDHIVIDLDDQPIETAQATLRQLRNEFPHCGIISICEDEEIEPITSALGVHNIYSALIMSTVT